MDRYCRLSYLLLVAFSNQCLQQIPSPSVGSAFPMTLDRVALAKGKKEEDVFPLLQLDLCMLMAMSPTKRVVISDTSWTEVGKAHWNRTTDQHLNCQAKNTSKNVRIK